jgi:NADPH-dependent curcumin reductase CurA
MVSQPVTTRIVLASRPSGKPVAANFRLERETVRDLAEGEVLLKTLYLSLDPYMRGRMDDAKSYAKPVEIGGVMEGGTVAQVAHSRNTAFKAGDIVLSHSGWQSYAISDGAGLQKLDPETAPITTALGILGMPALRPMPGFAILANPKPAKHLWSRQRAARLARQLDRWQRFTVRVLSESQAGPRNVTTYAKSSASMSR